MGRDMADESDICTAAFFRAKGKDVVTEKEFTMGIGLDLRWMSVKEAAVLLKMLVSEGCVSLNDGYVRPAKDFSDVQVPIAYKPSEDLRRKVNGHLSGPALSAPPKPKADDSEDMFPVMVDIATDNDIPKGKFVGECNRVRQNLGIDMISAALIVLRDSGADVSGLYEKVYAQVSRL